jgi:hypothetical protein
MDKITGTDYMINLARDLQAERSKTDGTKKPGLAESSAVSYIKNLYNLNDKKPFKSLAFLRNTEAIDAKLANYADNTKKTILGIIVGTLMATKFRSKKVIDHYRVQLDGNAKTLRELEGKNEKTEKQERNWISSDDVGKLKEERLKTLNEKLGNKAKISPAVYDELLAYLLVSLYTDTSPRRNQDYMKMVIVKKWNDKMPTDVNYLDLTGDRFVFNVYKTARKYGQHIVNIPGELRTTLTKYLKYHPNKGSKWATPQPFLVTGSGKELTAVNGITRILNKWFGKNVGSSMLRHIYLSGKYNIEEMKQDALDMGHSVEQQKAYMKNDKE